MKCLREKNKELEAKLRDMEKKLMDEKTAREAADAKVKALKKKAKELRDLKTAELMETHVDDQSPLAGEFIPEPPLSEQLDQARSNPQSRSNSLTRPEGNQHQRSNSSAGLMNASESIPETSCSTPMKMTNPTASKSNEEPEVAAPKSNDDPGSPSIKNNLTTIVPEHTDPRSLLRLRGSSDDTGTVPLSGTVSKQPNNLATSTRPRSRTASSDTFDAVMASNETFVGDDKGSLCSTNGEKNGIGRLNHASVSPRVTHTTPMGQHHRQQSSSNVSLGQLSMESMTNQMTIDSLNSQTGMGYTHNNGLQQVPSHVNMMMNQNGMMGQMGGISMVNGMVPQGMQQAMMGGVTVQPQGLGHVQLPNVQQMQNWAQQQQYPISHQQMNQQMGNQQQQQWVQQAVFQQEQQMVNQQQQMMQAQQQLFPQNQFQQLQSPFGQQVSVMSGQQVADPFNQQVADPFNQQVADPFNTLASRQQQPAVQQNQLWNTTGS
jgi:hypothetical protein